MVKIENITRKEEKRKLKIKRTKDLAKKFFENTYISDYSNSITISENETSPSFLSINTSLDKITLRIPESLIPKYTEKTRCFAEEYEKKFNVKNVVLETDYSN